MNINTCCNEDPLPGASTGQTYFTLFIIHLVGIPITGTSVNPARSIGPAIFAGGTAISQLWMFLVTPIIGAILAAIIWMYLLAPKKQIGS